MTPALPPVAIVGVGNMGGGMARRLGDGGFQRPKLDRQ